MPPPHTLFSVTQMPCPCRPWCVPCPNIPWAVPPCLSPPLTSRTADPLGSLKGWDPDEAALLSPLTSTFVERPFCLSSASPCTPTASANARLTFLSSENQKIPWWQNNDSGIKQNSFSLLPQAQCFCLQRKPYSATLHLPSFLYPTMASLIFLGGKKQPWYLPLAAWNSQCSPG